ncbi:unnamed protein product [Ambrosiozyma monospora]|uniref:Unnamed protein product n=1 Tax=Ambrosiozyma monospora TaxID=43982 RepID=A0ACB5T2Y4_AMBMO|nr:unnamed protein product [Ambrosiozyma monospora]
MPKSVLIVGCGVFGLSTAMELLEQGYTVTAIDRYEPPSPWSAACDYNKIIRAEYTDLKYTRLAIEAMQGWRHDPLFQPVYNECGRLMITPSYHAGRQKFEALGISNLHLLGEGKKIEYFHGGFDVASHFKHFRENHIQSNEDSKFNSESGLGHAGDSLKVVYERCKELGCEFVFGEDGEAKELKIVEGRTCVVTKTGLVFKADQVLVAMGANSGKLVDLNHQQSATGLFVTHIKLTPEEHEFYKDLPILFDAEMGYFFPPDPLTRILKIALPGSGASHNVTNPHDASNILSLPRFHNLNPTDTMPKSFVKKAKLLLAKYVPNLSYHELFDSKVCWIADTQDSDFIIDKVPGFNGLYVSTGDSGHAYKFLPIIGKYIVQRLDGSLSREWSKAWRWKEVSGEFDPTKCEWRVVDDFPDLSNIEWALESSKSKL